MYHGSKEKRDIIKVHDSNLSDKKVAFAITDKYAAVSFIPQWSDDDFQHGNIVHQGKKYWYMKEKYPDALKILETDGYLHTLKPDTFYRNERLGLVEEYITEYELKPINDTYIPNIRKYIDGYFTLIRYDEDVNDMLGIPKD